MSLYDKTSSVLPQKSSVIFGYLRQSSENVQKSSSGLRKNFKKSSEIFVSFGVNLHIVVENLRRIVKNLVICTHQVFLTLVYCSCLDSPEKSACVQNLGVSEKVLLEWSPLVMSSNYFSEEKKRY